MRIVQRIFLYLISVMLVLVGVAIAAYPFNESAKALVARASEYSQDWILCVLVGIALAAIGIFTLLPFTIFRKKGRAISFAGPNGTLEIQLDSFEASLQKIVGKLPMVKRAHINVTPEDSNRKVGIEANVSLKKPADMSTREAGERLEDFIINAARKILGADEVTHVFVRVKDFQVDSNQTAESLNSIFADAEKSVAPLPSVVPTPAPVRTPVAATAVATATAAVVAEDATKTYEPEIDDDGPYTAAAALEEVERPQSDDLLTYDEAEALQHPATSTAALEDDDADPLPPLDMDPAVDNVTSFESLQEPGEKPKD